MPEEYTLYQAAKYMGVAPWDLEERPVRWRDWALVFIAAEASAQKQIEKSQAKYQPRR